MKATGKPTEALRAYESGLDIRQSLADNNRSVTQFQDDLADSHNSIGLLLSEIGRPSDALKAYESALTIRRKLADDNPSVTEFQSSLARMHNNIGNLLSETGRPAEALKAYNAAIAIQQKLSDENSSVTAYQSRLALSHYNLGLLLRATGQPAKALEAFKSAVKLQRRLAEDNPTIIEFQDRLASSHRTIGVVLSETGRPFDALKAYESALTIRRKLADDNPSVTQFQSSLASIHNSVGVVMSQTDQPAEALKAYESALAIGDKLAREHPVSPGSASDLGILCNNIALIYMNENRLKEAQVRLRNAVDWQRKALSTNPANPTFRLSLVNHWISMIKVARGLDDSDLLAEAERELVTVRGSDPAMIALDARLSAIIRGDQQPRDNSELLQIAQRAYDKALYTSAAKFWTEALESDPNLANDHQAQTRYNAACAATLAGCGQGMDEPAPDDKAKEKLREHARGWLKAELAVWTKLVESGSAQVRKFVVQTLQHWQQDTDLAGIRDETALARLPEAERVAFRSLWADVDALLKKAEADVPGPPKQ